VKENGTEFGLIFREAERAGMTSAVTAIH